MYLYLTQTRKVLLCDSELYLIQDTNTSLHLNEAMWLFYAIATLARTNEMLPFQLILSNTTVWRVSWGRAVLASSHTKLFFQLKFSSAH